jgi:hypothetical protein
VIAPHAVRAEPMRLNASRNHYKKVMLIEKMTKRYRAQRIY